VARVECGDYLKTERDSATEGSTTTLDRSGRLPGSECEVEGGNIVISSNSEAVICLHDDVFLADEQGRVCAGLPRVLGYELSWGIDWL